MLRSARHLKFTIHATDGDLGHLDQFFFDDQDWAVRYLVVHTGGWLRGRRVLISPAAAASVDWEAGKINVNLTRRQVSESPDVETHVPLSRQLMQHIHQYYEWPIYWAGSAITGVSVYPSVLAGLEPPLSETQPQGEDAHLESTSDVAGYSVHAMDGDIGRVVDFIIDDQTWCIRQLVIETGTWLPGRHILLAPAYVTRVRWDEATVDVSVTRDLIRTAPAYHRLEEITPDYEAQLREHYGPPTRESNSSKNH